MLGNLTQEEQAKKETAAIKDWKRNFLYSGQYFKSFKEKFALFDL